MKSLPLIAALLLAGCARTEPITDNVVEKADVPAALPAEDAEREALPLTPGMRWEIDEPANAALYGADRASAQLMLRCDEDGGEKALVVSRFLPTVPSGAGTLTLTGNGAIASVPVVAEANEGRPGGRLSATLDPGALAQSIGAVFRGPDPVNVSTTGAEPLVLTGGPEVGMVLDNCLGPAAPARNDDDEAQPAA
ncbi:hypothetical protein [Sphingomicrobium nitratireducens]|uniref:hypothetical protein n=1 Tax=Sphingomicrobium nitratireducens TaxID=2964666 RepID=UPI002240DA02|nr:hypothetical protein [Sphingomicrobium nitratireducens]